MTLERIDTAAVINELIAIKLAFASGSTDLDVEPGVVPDIPPDYVAHRQVSRSVKRLRALLPRDPEMAGNVPVQVVLDTEEFLGELREAWNLGGEGVIFTDHRYVEIVKRLIQRFSQAKSDVDDPPPDDGAFLSQPDLAKKYGVDLEKLRKRLQRWRPKHTADWSEVDKADGNTDVLYLYRERAVYDQHIIKMRPPKRP